jgi:hypothetical protein
MTQGRVQSLGHQERDSPSARREPGLVQAVIALRRERDRMRAAAVRRHPPYLAARVAGAAPPSVRDASTDRGHVQVAGERLLNGLETGAVRCERDRTERRMTVPQDDAVRLLRACEHPRTVGRERPGDQPCPLTVSRRASRLVGRSTRCRSRNFPFLQVVRGADLDGVSPGDQASASMRQRSGRAIARRRLFARSSTPLPCAHCEGDPVSVGTQTGACSRATCSSASPSGDPAAAYRSPPRSNTMVGTGSREAAGASARDQRAEELRRTRRETTTGPPRTLVQSIRKRHDDDTESLRAGSMRLGSRGAEGGLRLSGVTTLLSCSGAAATTAGRPRRFEAGPGRHPDTRSPYQCEGSGSPTVLEAGYRVGHRDVRPGCQPALANTTQVCTYDARASA